MQRLKIFMVVIFIFPSFAFSGNNGILAPGAQWEEISRIGLATSEGVVADRHGMVYVSDISRAPISKDYYPCGTIWRYDP